MATRLVIHGRVQGVSYRDWAVATARSLVLSGWTRNRRDGTVEIVVDGADAAIDAFVRACGDGPPAARVERVDRSSIDEPVGPGAFIRRPTA